MNHPVKRMLAMLTVLLLVLGTLSLPAFAETSPAPYALVFSYDFKQHFLPGGKAIDVFDIMQGFPIELNYGNWEFDDVSVSDESLLRVSKDDHNVWYVEPLAEFSDKEWITVKLFGKEYTIYVTTAKAVTSDSISWERDQTYYLLDNVTINERITVEGTVHLMLGEGCTLTAPEGIFVPGKLVIEGSGTLKANATENNAAIGANSGSPGGVVEIRGGYVIARGDTHAAGIGGAKGSDSGIDAINIYGGTVEAYGGDAASGLGRGYGNSGVATTVRIYDGFVQAQGGGDYVSLFPDEGGAGVDADRVVVTGGSLIASSGGDAAGIGNSNTTGSAILVQITGGTVRALGIGGAGIGSATESYFEGHIEISGGYVTATSRHEQSYLTWMTGCGAGIGSGHGGIFEGTIRITGGTVYASGRDGDYPGGAGIGAAYGANAKKGHIKITGGNVTAVGGYRAAGIGGGAELVDGRGGEGCDDLEISGSANVTVEADYHAIGPGSRSSNSPDWHTGNLTLGDHMMVQGDTQVVEGGTILIDAAYRVEYCQNYGKVRISPCSHPDNVYTSSEDNHLRSCKYCATALALEAHTWDENHRCTVCGYGSDMNTVSFEAGEGSGTMDFVRVSPGSSFELPECAFTPPEGLVFAGWVISDQLHPAGDVISVDADSVNAVASWSQPYPLWVGSTQVTVANQEDILRDGTAAYDGNESGGTLTLKGARILSKHAFTSGGTAATAGIYAGENLDLTISVSGNSVIDAGAKYGVFSERGLSIQGGSALTAKGRDGGLYALSGPLSISGSQVTAQGEVYGLLTYDQLNISGSSVSAAATQIGVYADSLQVSGDSSLTAECDPAEGTTPLGIIVSMNLDSNKFILPEGGRYDIESHKVLDADGNPVMKAEIGRAVPYPLWVGGTQVSDANAADVLGDGAVSYDRASHTLTFYNNPTFAGTYGSMLIAAEENLTIVAPQGGLRLTGADAAFGAVALNGASLEIRGDVEANVSSTAIRAEGSVRLTGSLTGTCGGSGLVAENGSVSVGGDVDLTVQGEALIKAAAGLSVDGSVTGTNTSETGYGLWAGGDLTVGGDVGISAARAGLEIQGSVNMSAGTWDVAATAEGGRAILAEGGIYLPPTHAVTAPENSPFQNGDLTVSDASGAEAAHVVIGVRPVVPETVSVTFVDGDRTLFTRTYESNCPIANPGPRMKDGYAFQGWYLEDTPWDFGAVVTQDMTLAAAWEEIPLPSLAENAPADTSWTKGEGSAESRTLTVTVTDENQDGLEYQWYRTEGSWKLPLADGRQSAYTIPENTDAGEYQYYCLVTRRVGNGAASTASREASVTVLPPAFGTPDFTLPASLTAVEMEAFEGISASVVDVPASCRSLGAYAFRNCRSLTQIRVPADCELGEEVFDGCGTVYIYGAPGSSAEAWCSSLLNHNCIFVPVE